MDVPFFRSGFNYDRAKVSDESGLACPPEEGRAQQQFRDEVNINTIVERFGLTGELPDNWRAPVSGDFTGISDFHTAMNAVRAAQESFNAMPAELRSRFSHDPSRLMAFLDDEKNRDEAVKLGLVQLPPEKPRDVVQAVDELRAAMVSSGSPVAGADGVKK